MFVFDVINGADENMSRNTVVVEMIEEGTKILLHMNGCCTRQMGRLERIRIIHVHNPFSRTLHDVGGKPVFMYLYPICIGKLVVEILL